MTGSEGHAKGVLRRRSKATLVLGFVSEVLKLAWAVAPLAAYLYVGFEVAVVTALGALMYVAIDTRNEVIHST